MIALQLTTAFSAHSTGTEFSVDGQVPVSQNSTWRFVVGTFNGTLLSLYLNGILNDTEQWTGTQAAYFNTTLGRRGNGEFYGGDIDQLTIWNRSLSASEITELYDGGRGLAFNQQAQEVITLIAPLNNSIQLTNSPTFQASLTPNVLANNTNMTIYLYNSTGLFNRTTNIITGNVTNSTSWIINGLSLGTYNWNALGCTDSNNCSFAASNFTFTIGANPIHINYANNTFETYREFFQTNLTIPNFTSLSSANLFYKGTSYSGTISNIAGNNYSLTRLLDVPIQTNITQTNSFFWSLNFNTGFQQNLSSVNQNSNITFFTLCNASITTRFLNFSFADEGNLTILDGTIPTSTFQWWLGGGSQNKTLNYINNTANRNYVFCATPIYHTFNVDAYVQYAGTGYPQRIYNPSTLSLTNNTLNQSLYLLATADGQYVTFQVINTANQALSDVTITATRNIGGNNVVVGTGITGADGSATFWLNPNFIHTFTFEKTGFTTLTDSFAPTQTGYTITLTGGEAIQNSTIRGISYTINPTDRYLYNDTTYSFNFTLTSNYWDIESYGFNLRLANGTIISGGTSTSAGTTINFNYNTGNQTIIYMDYFWVINSQYTNSSRYWVIQNTDYTSWSLATLFTDLNLYMDSGLFGLDDFGRYLIVFLILFTISGIVSFKYGISSPLSVSMITFATIFFFDIVVGIIPEIRGVDNLLTYLSALVLVIMILREAQT